jgi:ketosteroid isomerase-like protein
MAKKVVRKKKHASTARKPKPAAKRSTRANVARPARRKPAPRRPPAAGNPVRELAKRIVELTVDQNDAIIIEWAGRVTFAATGKMADLNEVAIHEVANGKIVRERFYYDRAALQP